MFYVLSCAVVLSLGVSSRPMKVVMPSISPEKIGIAALEAYDTNGDGRIDTNQAAHPALREIVIPHRPECRLPPRVRQFHVAIAGLQILDRRGAEPMLAAHLSRRHAGFLFLDRPDDLNLGETALPHVVRSSRLGGLYITARSLPGGGRSAPSRASGQQPLGARFRRSVSARLWKCPRSSACAEGIQRVFVIRNGQNACSHNVASPD